METTAQRIGRFSLPEGNVIEAYRSGKSGKGNMVGVNRDGQSVGMATRIKGDQWSVKPYRRVAPFEWFAGVQTLDAAIMTIATMGEAR